MNRCQGCGMAMRAEGYCGSSACPATIRYKRRKRRAYRLLRLLMSA